MLTREYVDSLGRRFQVLIADENDPLEYGHIIGPPFLDDLDLPEETMVHLHNELYARGVITQRDAKRKTGDIIGALIAAFKVDAVKIIELYGD
jgi:hypothetical protein